MRSLLGVALVVLGVSGIASGLLVIAGGGTGGGFGVWDTLIGVGLLIWGIQLQRTPTERWASAAPNTAPHTYDRTAEFEAHEGYWRDLGQQWVTSSGEASRDFPTLHEAQQAYLTMGYMIVAQSRPFDLHARPTAADGRITLTLAPIMPSMLS
jgi:hypothetical protein